VALALLGTLVLVVGAASVSGGRTLEKISSGIRRNAEILRIDSTLRGCAQRIVVPYWLSGPAYEGTDRGLSISWLDGSQAKSLSLSLQNGSLVVDDGSQATSFPGVADARMEIASPDQGAAPALILTIRLEGADPFKVIASLGAVSFPVVGPH
jgi:hypothetical protein